jgi:hypothetical protein
MLYFLALMEVVSSFRTTGTYSGKMDSLKCPNDSLQILKTILENLKQVQIKNRRRN